MTDLVSPGVRGTLVPTGEPNSFLHFLDGEGKAVGLGNGNPILWLDLLHCLNSLYQEKSRKHFTLGSVS